MCAALLLFESLASCQDVGLNEVVSQDDAYLLAVREMFGDSQRIRDAPLALLVSLVKVPETKIASIAQQAKEVARVLPACHKQNISYPRVDQGLERIKDHGLVEHWQQVLVRHPRQRVQAGSQTSSKDDSFHGVCAPSSSHKRRDRPANLLA